MWRVWLRRGQCKGSWWINRRERDHWGDLGVDCCLILNGSTGGGMSACGLDWAGPG